MKAKPFHLQSASSNLLGFEDFISALILKENSFLNTTENHLILKWNMKNVGGAKPKYFIRHLLQLSHQVFWEGIEGTNNGRGINWLSCLRIFTMTITNRRLQSVPWAASQCPPSSGEPRQTIRLVSRCAWYDLILEAKKLFPKRNQLWLTLSWLLWSLLCISIAVESMLWDLLHAYYRAS